MRRSWRKLLWETDGTQNLPDIGYDDGLVRVFFVAGGSAANGFTTVGSTFLTEASADETCWFSVDTRDADSCEFYYTGTIVDAGALASVSLMQVRSIAIRQPTLSEYLPKAVRNNPLDTFDSITAVPYRGLMSNYYLDTQDIGTSSDESNAEPEPRLDSGGVEYGFSGIFDPDDLATGGTSSFNVLVSEKSNFENTGSAEHLTRRPIEGVKRTERVFVCFCLINGVIAANTDTTKIAGRLYAVLSADSDLHEKGTGSV